MVSYNSYGQRGKVSMLILTAHYSVWYQQGLQTRPVPIEGEWGCTILSCHQNTQTLHGEEQTGREPASIHSSSNRADRRLDLPRAPSSLRGGARLHHELRSSAAANNSCTRTQVRDGSWEGRWVWKENQPVCQLLLGVDVQGQRGERTAATSQLSFSGLILLVSGDIRQELLSFLS